MSQTTVSSKVIRPISLAHVVLRTTPTKFKEMVSFYKTLLGAEPSFETDNMTFLRYDEEHHRVAIIAFPDSTTRTPNSVGMHHMAFTFSTLADLAQSYKQRKAHNILPTMSMNHGPTTSIYYTDPDGNMIETQVDNFDTNEEVQQFMESKEWIENPLGVDFEPEDFVRRVESGEDDKSIKKRIEIGKREL